MRKYLGVVVLMITFCAAAFAQADSLGIEKQGDKVFVVHKVKAKQTLFSLAKRYKTSVTEINTANPELANGLQIGQTLKIPFGGTIASPNKKPVETTTEELSHKVAAGETLFAIARKYEVSVTDLKSWNQLSSNSLSLGQDLKIRVVKPVEAAATKSETPIVTDISTEEVLPDTTELSVLQPSTPTDTTLAERVIEPEPIAYDGTPFQSFEVEGVAEAIEEDEPSTKFFALHRTARVGTVIKVKNLMNDLTVYVRVVGTIPDTSVNDNIIIKLNQKAYTHLKAIDKRFRVQLSYFQ
mgnify:CR=1 FL=1